ncbi:peroxisomal membrane anchor protein conserved region-domain-containing protein [Xylogone sp. PMI_703]|nr:peroxisomal membrane anchor protein conserved region-domain-containing protein [Xylogone sp. PMI_703]
MTIREDLVTSAVSISTPLVTLLQDPSVSSSPIESRIAFLQSKNLTQEEIDAALARTSGEGAPAPAPAANYSNYGSPQPVVRAPQGGGYGAYPPFNYQQPPEVPKRDWRDWFIMATVTGGIGYGLYFLAKRYVYPVIAPPTPPQLEQDKKAIDESFEKAFALLDQLAKDTEALKSSEQARTERLDSALADVESVISDLKAASRRREEESRRIGDEVRTLKDLIPTAMESQKTTTDNRLKELNSELKSLKTLLSQRMNAPTPAGTSFTRPGSSASITPTSITTGISGTTANGSTATNTTDSAPQVSNGVGNESPARSSTPFATPSLPGRASIPAWQMAASSKSTSSVPTTSSTTVVAQEGNTSS